MSGAWYIENYAEDGFFAEGCEEHETYEAALSVVRVFREAGKTTRFMAPVGATRDQIDAFIRLGLLERI